MCIHMAPVHRKETLLERTLFAVRPPTFVCFDFSAKSKPTPMLTLYTLIDLQITHKNDKFPARPVLGIYDFRAQN